MVSSGKTGRGVVFRVRFGGGPWVPIGNVTSIDLSDRNLDSFDVTHLGSPVGYRETRPAGLRDAGTLTVACHLSPEDEGQVALLSYWYSGATVEWSIDFSEAGWDYAMVGSGFVRSPGDRTIEVGQPVGGGTVIRVVGETEYVPAGTLDFSSGDSSMYILLL